MTAPTFRGPDVGYVDLLDALTTERLKKEKAEGKYKDKSPARPSAAGKCERELAYELMEFHGKASYPAPVNEPEVERLLNLGHAIESHLIRQMEAAFGGLLQIRYKQQVLSFARLDVADAPELGQWLEGSLDMVFWSDKHKCVADVKSKKDKFHAFYKTDWDATTEKLKAMRSVATLTDKAFWVEDLEAFLEELNEPFFAANFLQLNLYASSDFLKERGVDHAAIIQYCKNDSRLREIRFKPSDSLAKQTIAKFQRALEAVKAGAPEQSKRSFLLGSIKCAFCKYAGECWGGTDTKKPFFETFPPKKWPTDTSRLGKLGEGLEKLFVAFTGANAAAADAERAERAILALLAEREVDKIRLKDGTVWQVKQLKAGLALRRTKV